jgi:hypothetical protein
MRRAWTASAVNPAATIQAADSRPRTSPCAARATTATANRPEPTPAAPGRRASGVTATVRPASEAKSSVQVPAVKGPSAGSVSAR